MGQFLRKTPLKSSFTPVHFELFYRKAAGFIETSATKGVHFSSKAQIWGPSLTPALYVAHLAHASVSRKQDLQRIRAGALLGEVIGFGLPVRRVHHPWS